MFNLQKSLGAKIAQPFDERFPRLFRPDLEVGFLQLFREIFSLKYDVEMRKGAMLFILYKLNTRLN